MNRYPLHPRPKRWNAKLSPFWIRILKSLRRYKQRNEQQLYKVEVRGIENVQQAVLDAGAGVLIIPNHPGHADAYIMYEAAEKAGFPFYFMSAWQVFEVQSLIGRWMLQVHGCFSVDREGADRQAFRNAVEILQNKKNPLVIFAEGEVYHQNDRITPFREGAAAMAITAARKVDRPVLCVPCAMKYQYIEDPMPELLEVMDKLEEKILWRPRRDLPLKDRIYHFAEGILSLKEIEYMGCSGSGKLPNRIEQLADTILKRLEIRYELISPADCNINTGKNRTIPERVKAVRQTAIECLDKLDNDDCNSNSNKASENVSGSVGHGDEPAGTHRPLPEFLKNLKNLNTQREAIACDLDDVFIVMQAFSYPGDYLVENPTVERMAETLDKFEEDVLGVNTATIRAPRKAVVVFGEPIAVPGTTKEMGGSNISNSSTAVNIKKKKMKPFELTQQMEIAVQTLLDGI